MRVSLRQAIGVKRAFSAKCMVSAIRVVNGLHRVTGRAQPRLLDTSTKEVGVSELVVDRADLR